MPLGYGLLACALIATVAANVLFVVGRGRNTEAAKEAMLAWARRMVYVATASVIGASVYLSYLIATHQFQVAYVAEYSSMRSNKWYLFASFWGGQEGSILLWTFWTAVLGAVLAARARGEMGSRVWPIYGVLQVYLLGLLLLKCPFKLGAGPVPADGRGLNPLLENPWMVIHPPMLFLGFAALMPVFAWCLYGLVYRDWDGWAKAAFSWTLFAFATLGFGLSLGGYWAYETLGWGGFWGWDPVENSSLVPWLAITALLHGLAIQHKNGGYKVTNLLLGFLPFAYMFYGTFLTRSGLLTDFSVHSFSSLGKDGYIMLLTGVIASFLIPLVLLIARGRQIPKPPAYENVLTREFGFFLASALFGIIGLLVAVGMSAPLITKMWMEKGASAQPDFYNKALYPLAIILTVAMAATPYLGWKSTDDKELGKRLLKPYLVTLVISMVMTGFAFMLGVRKPLMVLLFATSTFSVIANLWLIFPRMKHAQSRKTIGGFVAHAGAGMLLAGCACLVAFSQTAERVALLQNRPTKVLDYTLTYKGMSHNPYDRDNNALEIEVRRGKYVWHARPRYYFAPWSGKDTLFANPPAILPSIYNVKSPYDLLRLLPWNNPFLAGDLYISYSGGPGRMPMLTGETPPGPNDGLSLGMNESKTVGEYMFTLRNFGIDEKAQAALRSREEFEKLSEFLVTATVEVEWRDKKAVVEPKLRVEAKGGAYALPVAIPGPDGRQVMLAMDPPSDEDAAHGPLNAVTLRTLNAEDPYEVILVDVSTKPMIGLVWIGSLLYTLGGLIAYRRRAQEAGLM
jgi:cytochrome c-type biogenesis protein CcmF